jgi:transketolase
MADIKKIATRDAYGSALAALGEKYENFVVLDADLASATKTGTFKKKFPSRHFDCGIQEGNMMLVAAGIAATGLLVPFASTFAIFAAGRAYEQIRNGIGYPHLNVKIAATHAGISVGEDGATHQCSEDIGTMRTIPGMTIISPSDAVETAAAVEAALNYVGPVYIRLGRLAVPVINDADSYKFELGKGVVFADGSDAAIFATGMMVDSALQARELLKTEGIDAAVINIHTIKPLDEELVVKYAAKTGAIVTAEEHQIIGGLGAAICETLSENHPCPVKRVGMKDKFGKSGKPAALLEEYGLTPADIAANVRAAIAMKHK